MGTLYECLKEAKLEKYYGTFRAHGITKTESLLHITPHDFITFGITSLEDRHQLLELINIIKSVHLSEGYSVASGRSRQSKGGLPRKRNRSPVSAASGGGHGNQWLSAVNDVRVRDNRSTTSHRLLAGQDDIFDLLASSSSSEDSGSDLSEHSDYEPATKHLNAASSSPPINRKVCSENVKVKHAKGYNYGVPTGAEKLVVNIPKNRSNKSLSRRSREERIKVCVRKRPMNRREKKVGENDIVAAESTTVLKVNEPKQAVDLRAYTLQHEFIFDEVFDENCSNEDVYIRAARPLIHCLFDGGSATCFAYGQTGAGKTHTMIGNQEIPGLYLLASHDIFSIIESQQNKDGIKVWVSFFEIYCGQLFDLLNKRNRLNAREDGSQRVCIQGLTETEADNVQALMQVLEYGNAVRSKGATGVNPDSSRSHAILQLELRNWHDKRIGKISFIDLAGSERASDVTDTDRQTRMEGAEINQSLLALKECIRSIDQESRHTPFRQSKLTHILKDSFIGNSLTCMIANISPTHSACEHTLNTLRYADRVKELRREGNNASTRASLASPLLMNIPAAAPTIFHPSNISCSSTPVRPTSGRRSTQRPQEHFNLDPNETPIKGSFMRRKTVNNLKKSPKQNSKPKVFKPLPPQTNVSVVRHVPQIQPVIRGAVSVGVSSESDQTDTDSCNVTGSRPAFTEPTTGTNIPVIGSTDTENDFPTTDFNDEEVLNDLNRHGEKTAADVPRDKRITASVPAFDTSLLKMRNERAGNFKPSEGEVYMSTPVLRPKSYKTDSPKQTPPSDITSTRLADPPTTRSQPVIIPVSSQPKLSESSPQHHFSFLQPTTASTESFEDDLLFITPEEQQSSQNVVSHVGDTVTSRSTLAPDRLPVTPRTAQNLGLPSAIPAVLPAKSSDLTTFSVRSPQRVGLKRSPQTPPPFQLTEKRASDKVSLLSHTVGSDSLNLSDQEAIESCAPSSGYKNYKNPVKPLDNVLSTSKENSIEKEPISLYASQTTENAFAQELFDNYRTTEFRNYEDLVRGETNINNNALSSVVTTSSDYSLPSDHWYKTPVDHGTHIASSTSKLYKHGSTTPGVQQTSSDSKISVLSHEQLDQKLASDTASDQSQTLAKEIESDFPEFLAMPTRNRQSDMQGFNELSPAHSRLNALLKELTASALNVSVKAGKSMDLRLNHSDSNLPSSTHSLEPDTSIDHTSEIATRQKRDNDNYLRKNSANTLAEDNSIAQINIGRLPSSDSNASIEELNIIASSRDSKVDYDDKTNLNSLRQSTTPSEKDISRFNNNNSPIAMSVVTREPVIGGRTAKSNSPFSGKSLNSAIKTEKLHGSMFSPIHPQPLTKNGLSKNNSAVSKIIVQPQAVTNSTTDTGPKEVNRSLCSNSNSEQLDTSGISRVIASHEDQLATVTSLCKQEMKLLLGAKAGSKSYVEYVQRVSNILQQKMTAIQMLQKEIGCLTLSPQDSCVSSST